jgi:hypothetical protein
MTLWHCQSDALTTRLDLIHKSEIIGYCRGPNAVVGDGEVDAPNSQLISCLDSSLGRASAWSPGGRRFAPRPWHVCLGALLEDRDDPGQVSLYYVPLRLCTLLGAESIEWFIEDQTFYPSYDLVIWLLRPLPSAIFLSFSVFPLKIYCLKESQQGVGTRTKLFQLQER